MTVQPAPGGLTMAAASTYARHEGVAAHGWIVAALAMLALALGSGYALALGELAGLAVGLSLVFAVAVLFDFRVGAVLLLLMMPVSASTLFPHGLMGIIGLNPLNLLLVATLAAYVVHGRMQRAGAVMPPQLVFLYIAPIAVAGLIGVRHVDEIPSFFYELGHVYSERQYVVQYLMKPFVIVAVALMVGAAAARVKRPERFIVAIAVGALLVALAQIGFVLAEGVPLARMAAPGEREFYAPLGMHANLLGRLHMFALALLLFVWAETKQPQSRLFLIVTIAVVGVALLLTFSRASIAATLIVGALFLMWKFNARVLSLGLLGLLLVALLAGDVLYARLTHGFGEGADAVSAGRLGLWAALAPEVFKSPLWGHGLHSILWSTPVLTGVLGEVGHAHNAYLGAVLDMGFIGAGLLLAYYVHVWRGFRSLEKSDQLTAEMRGLFQGARAGLVAFFVTGLVGSSLEPEPEWAYLWIAIGLMYGMRARRPAA